MITISIEHKYTHCVRNGLTGENLGQIAKENNINWQYWTVTEIEGE